MSIMHMLACPVVSLLLLLLISIVSLSGFIRFEHDPTAAAAVQCCDIYVCIGQSCTAVPYIQAYIQSVSFGAVSVS